MLQSLILQQNNVIKIEEFNISILVDYVVCSEGEYYNEISNSCM